MPSGLGRYHDNLYTTPVSTPTKKSIPIPTRSTPPVPPYSAGMPSSLGSYEDDLDIITRLSTLKRPRQSPSLSPSLPERQHTLAKLEHVAILPPNNEEVPSSQTDSTFHPSSEMNSCETGSQRSAGDRNESSVSNIYFDLLKVICRVHKRSNGYQFEAGLDTDTLSIPIRGDFPRTTPDIILRLEKSGKKLHIFDIEAC
ncbi:hypothetical protein MMC14_010265, partial [Varicellaria rhodocarpa]|nr:hypothetical protein [Varicellaria rhodocarpa]